MLKLHFVLDSYFVSTKFPLTLQLEYPLLIMLCQRNRTLTCNDFLRLLLSWTVLLIHVHPLECLSKDADFRFSKIFWFLVPRSRGASACFAPCRRSFHRISLKNKMSLKNLSDLATLSGSTLGFDTRAMKPTGAGHWLSRLKLCHNLLRQRESTSGQLLRNNIIFFLASGKLQRWFPSITTIQQNTVYWTTIYRTDDVSNYSLSKRRFIKSTVYRNDGLSNRQFIETTVYQIDSLSKRQFIEPTVYRNDSSSNRQFIETTVHRIDSLSKRQFIESTVYRIDSLSNCSLSNNSLPKRLIWFNCRKTLLRRGHHAVIYSSSRNSLLNFF